MNTAPKETELETVLRVARHQSDAMDFMFNSIFKTVPKPVAPTPQEKEA